MIFRFGDFELDDRAYELRKNGRPCHTEPLIFDLIAYLLRTNGRVVSRDDIVEHVWDGRFVSDATISGGIKSARQALGDSGEQQRYIRTIRGRGFQFVAGVEAEEQVPPAGASNIQVKVATEPAKPLTAEPSEATSAAPSIAVLPIRLLTPSERYGALGDALSHDVIIELARLHWLHVINRGSTFAFRDEQTELSQVAQVLGARYVLSGTMTLHGETSVVTVELSETSGMRIVWADRFEQPVNELLQLKGTIAARIVRAVETRIQSAEVIAAGRIPTDCLDAWSAYHRGLWHMFRFTQADNAASAEFFNRAIGADPQFARAHAALSFTHFQNAFLNFSNDRAEDLKQARVLSERALAIDPFDPFVNLTMGRTNWISGDLEAAVPWLERSIELSPNYAFAIYNRALIGVLQGEGDVSAAQADRAMSLSPIDPLSYAMLSTRGMAHMVKGEFQEATRWAKRAIQVPNAHFQIFVIAAVAYECAGDRETANTCVAKLRERHASFRPEEFFKAFPFEGSGFRKTVSQAFKRLGLT